MAQITINKISDIWSEVIINPAHNGTSYILVNKANGLDKVKVREIPEMADIIKLHFNDGEVLDLHFSVGVVVDGTTATSTDHLKELIKTHLTT